MNNGEDNVQETSDDFFLIFLIHGGPCAVDRHAWKACHACFDGTYKMGLDDADGDPDTSTEFCVYKVVQYKRKSGTMFNRLASLDPPAAAVRQHIMVNHPPTRSDPACVCTLQ